jgi:hypothetical protein
VRFSLMLIIILIKSKKGTCCLYILLVIKSPYHLLLSPAPCRGDSFQGAVKRATHAAAGLQGEHRDLGQDIPKRTAAPSWPFGLAFLPKRHGGFCSMGTLASNRACMVLPHPRHAGASRHPIPPCDGAKPFAIPARLPNFYALSATSDAHPHLAPNALALPGPNPLAQRLLWRDRLQCRGATPDGLPLWAGEAARN